MQKWKFLQKKEKCCTNVLHGHNSEDIDGYIYRILYGNETEEGGHGGDAWKRLG
jgi:hypothetical protein